MPQNGKDHLYDLGLLRFLQFLELLIAEVSHVLTVFVRVQGCSVYLDVPATLCVHFECCFRVLLILKALFRLCSDAKLAILSLDTELLVHERMVRHSLDHLILAGLRNVKAYMLFLLLSLRCLLLLVDFVLDFSGELLDLQKLQFLSWTGGRLLRVTAVLDELFCFLKVTLRISILMHLKEGPRPQIIDLAFLVASRVAQHVRQRHHRLLQL